MVSYLVLVFIVIAILYIEINSKLAVLFMVLSLMMDWLDGSLARYLKKSSDRGKFTDVVVDTTSYMIFVAGLAMAGFVSAGVGVIYGFVLVSARLFITLHRSYGKKTNWLIKPIAGFWYNAFAYLPHLFFVLYAFSGINYVEVVVSFVALVFAVMSAVFFVRVRRLKK